MEFEDLELEESSTQSGMKKFGRILAIGIILVVAGFGDVMYIRLMSDHFPPGLLMALCYVGAFTSFLAIAYMLIGKSILFAPGLQMIAAWFVFLAELAAIALNIILVFQGDGANATGFLAVWWQLAPATPVFNMAGVAILYFLDEENKMRHEDMELSWDMKRANRRHFKAMARARLRLQNKQLNFLVTELDRAVAAPESLKAIQQTAIELNQYLLGQLSGGRTYRLPSLPAGATVDSNPPDAPTPPPVPTQPTPEPEKKRGWFANPFARKDDPPVYTTPKQNRQEMQEMFRQFMDEERQRKEAEAAQKAPSPDTSYADDLAASVPPAQSEAQYVVNREPIPDNPGPKATAPAPTGPSLNGHSQK